MYLSDMRTCLLYILTIISVNVGVIAQAYIYQADFQTYSDALYAQKLVRNNNQVVPLQRLDTLAVATWFGKSQYATIYRNATDMYLPAVHLQSIDEETGSTNALIIGLDRDHEVTVGRFRDLAARSIVVAIVFDRAVYETLPLDAADAVIHAYHQDTLSAHVAIQQIFGGSPFGVYSVSFPDIQRLGFAPAAAALSRTPT